MINRILISSLLVIIVVTGAVFFYGCSLRVPEVTVPQKLSGRQTVASVMGIIGEPARSRLIGLFRAANIAYPPKKVSLLAIKDQAVMELWVESPQGQQFIRSYPIKALSGVPGPKLREGDRQVPEGIYKIEGLNPNSSYHLSMKLNYPNTFDQKFAAAENRTEPGTNIFIHGKAVSIGCLAMGDVAIEELFALAVDVGKTSFSIAIAPSDPRKERLRTNIKPEWVSVLYEKINVHFDQYRKYKS